MSEHLMGALVVVAVGVLAAAGRFAAQVGKELARSVAQWIREAMAELGREVVAPGLTELGAAVARACYPPDHAPDDQIRQAADGRVWAKLI